VAQSRGARPQTEDNSKPIILSEDGCTKGGRCTPSGSVKVACKRETQEVGDLPVHQKEEPKPVWTNVLKVEPVEREEKKKPDFSQGRGIRKRVSRDGRRWDYKKSGGEVGRVEYPKLRR